MSGTKDITITAAEEDVPEPETPSITGGGGMLLLNLPVQQGSIQSNLNTIAALQAQIAALLSSQSGVTVSEIPTGFIFAKQLNYGMIGGDVKFLQIFLNTYGFQLANSGAGSPGHETNKFGLLTYEAIKKFQQKYASEILTPQGFKNPTGIVASYTIKKLNSLLGH